MSKKKSLLQSLKIAISVGLIVFLIWKISPGRLVPYIKGIDWAYLSASIAVFFLSSFLGAVQWYILLSESGINPGFASVLKLYLVGLFFNNFLPANVGGDAVKIFDVTKMGNDPYRVFAVTLLDRIFGIFGLCLLALSASLILLPRGIIDNLGVYLLIFAACVSGVAVFMLNRRLARLVRRILTGIRLWNIGERLEIIFDQLGGLRKLRSVMGKVTALALVVQFLRISTHILVGRSIGIDISGMTPVLFFVFVPLLGLIMILPISINGLGVREGTGVLLFTSVGIGTEQALLVEFLTYVVMVAVSLAGGFLFLKRHLGPK